MAALQQHATQCTAFAVGVAERTGKKGEDRAAIVPRFTGAEDYVAVFDGHRGIGVVTHAAATLHTELAAALSTQEPPEACASAFAACHESARLLGCRDGTAALCLFTRDGGREVWLANAGDCRAVLCPAVPGAPPQRLTVDHRAEEPSEQARIEAAGGLVEFGQLEGMLALSRGLGDFDFCASGFSQAPHVAGPLQMAEGDAVLLASDGVFDVLSDAEAAELVRAALRGGRDLGATCRELTAQAAARGSRDDKTALLVWRRPSAGAGAAQAAARESPKRPRSPGLEAARD